MSVLPATIAISIKQNAKVVLAEAPARIETPRSEVWRQLLVNRPRSERNFLSRFAGLMTRHRVEPEGVTEGSFALYRQYLEEAAV